MKKEKKKPYPSLRKKSNTRIRQQLIDYDYINKLDEESLRFLAKFTNEYYNANLELDENKDIIPEANLHQTPEHKKEIYDNNNKRNSDLLGVITTQSGKVKRNLGKVRIINWESGKWQVDEEISEKSGTNVEDSMIEYLDYVKKLEE